MTDADKEKTSTLGKLCRKGVCSFFCVTCFSYILLYKWNLSEIIQKVIFKRGPLHIKQPDVSLVFSKLETVEYWKRESNKLTIIPHNIYMLWDQGWPEAPTLQKECLESFRRLNPEFNIITMNISRAEELIDVHSYYSNKAWDSASIQAKSDIIRVELLAKYGGIWADASVYCNEPLQNWLNDGMLPVRFLAYERKDKRVNTKTSPWISSWFLVSSNDSYIIQTWRDKIRKAWKRDPIPSKFQYFWLHRIFSHLVHDNKEFSEKYKLMPLLDAGGPHCMYKDLTPYVYKIKARACSKVRENILN